MKCVLWCQYVGSIRRHLLWNSWSDHNWLWCASYKVAFAEQPRVQLPLDYIHEPLLSFRKYCTSLMGIISCLGLIHFKDVVGMNGTSLLYTFVVLLHNSTDYLCKFSTSTESFSVVVCTFYFDTTLFISIYHSVYLWGYVTVQFIDTACFSWILTCNVSLCCIIFNYQEPAQGIYHIILRPVI